MTTLRVAYDAYGRVLDSFDALGRKTSNAYSPAAGAPVTSASTTNPKGWVSTATIDPARGDSTRLTDDNGRVTDSEFDALGRLVQAWGADWPKSAHPSLPSARFGYTVRASGGPTAVTSSVLNTAGDGMLTSYTLYDGFLRQRQTQAPAATGTGRLVTDTFFDSRGLQVKSNPTYYDSGSPETGLADVSDLVVPAQNRTSYDGAGRPMLAQFMSQAVERWHTSNAYGGDRIDVTPPDGGTATSTITDARGRQAELRQYHGPTPTPTNAASYDRTRYEYDHAGHKTRMVDQAGIVWSWGYDQRGRNVSAADPDKGSTTLTYDDAGQILSSTDARNMTLTRVYDELGRQTQLWQGAVSTGTKLTETIYDTILKGLYTSKIRYVGGQSYTTTVDGYDAGYRPTSTTVSIPATQTGLAGNYTFTSTYTANGSVATQTAPAAGGLSAETLITGYTATGLPRTLSGDQTYVSNTTYLQTGELTSQTHGTDTAYRAYTYDPVTHRLAQQTAQAVSTPDILEDASYAYDASGNIKKISNQLEQ